MSQQSKLIESIRRGALDINSQELFFSTLIKGLILNLNNKIKIRGTSVPHYILHTGDDIMYLERKGQDNSTEPESISNENYIYSQIPRCTVDPGGINILSDQLTSPGTTGNLEFIHDNFVYGLAGQFRRIPLNMSFTLNYVVDSYVDFLSLVQQLISHLYSINTFYITYLGQAIACSYKLPESSSDERMMDLEGSTTEPKQRKVNIEIELETNLPVWNNSTIMSTANIIVTPVARINPDAKIGKNLHKEIYDDDSYNILQTDRITDPDKLESLQDVTEKNGGYVIVNKKIKE